MENPHDESANSSMETPVKTPVSSYGSTSQHARDQSNRDVFTQGNSELDATDNRYVSQVAVSLTLKIIVFTACTSSIVLSMGFGFGLSVLYAQLIRVFDEDRSVLSLIQSIFQTLISVGGILWSRPVVTYGYGFCIVIGGAIGSIAISVSSFIVNVPAIIVLNGVVAGATFGILFLGPYVIVARLSEKYKTALIGFVQIGNSVGQFAFPPIMEVLIEQYKWNGCIFIVGALCLNAVPIGIIISIFEKRTTPVSAFNGQDTTANNTKERGLFKLNLMKSLIFWLLMINSFILAFAQIEVRFIVDLAIVKGFDISTGSLFLTVIGIGNLIGSLLGSLQKVVCKWSSSAHMVYLMLLLAGSHLLVMFLDSYGALVTASFLNGLCIGALYAHVGVVLYEIYGVNDYASSFAFYNIFKGVGQFLGGYMGGLSFDATGSYNLVLAASAGFGVYYAITFLGITVYEKMKAKPNYEHL